MKKIVVLTGSGISAESGLKTFRDSGGLWEGFKVEEVASPQGFQANPERVLEFYNQRRKQAQEALPNAGHEALVKLEQAYEVFIVTQNVDDLHERAGSSQVLHLHGQLNKARSVVNEDCICEMEGDIKIGDLGEDGHQLRPHIVWFGESVPMMEEAAILSSIADIFVIIGTSLSVYPANGLVNFVSEEADIYLVDPVVPAYALPTSVNFFQHKASVGVPLLVEQLLKDISPADTSPQS
ncbi:MAG: NAD-dependent deacylase [Bacteroidota bacterium]